MNEPVESSTTTDRVSPPSEPGDPGLESLASAPVDADATPPGPRTFAEMDLDPAVKQALDDMGYEVPMEVQRAVYGPIRAGQDLMVQSRTGSGKTAAFGIPLAHIVDPGRAAAQALALVPTRELAIQVARELERIVAYRNLQVVPVYGGAPMGKQIEALKAGAQIVVGTPGRVLDHLRRGTFVAKSIRALVLDECDEMLSMGFQEEIEKIIAELPRKEHRQTLLFSATIPEEIERIGRRHMREYEKIVLSADFIGVHAIAHRYYTVSGMARTRDLLRVLEIERPGSAIIFCNTREDTGVVASILSQHGYDAEAISSDLSQPERERVMKRMRDRNLKFLCATDIAARGIDISGLPCVVNYTFPESPEVYIHRTGRTGRAGASGVAISLIGPREVGSFYYLKLIYKIRPEERELPTENELRSRREGDRYLDVARRVNGDPGDEWRSLARRVWQSQDGERILAGLLRQTLEGRAEGPSATRNTRHAAPPPPAPGVRDERRGERERSPRRDEPRPRQTLRGTGVPGAEERPPRREVAPQVEREAPPRETPVVREALAPQPSPAREPVRDDDPRHRRRRPLGEATRPDVPPRRDELRSEGPARRDDARSEGPARRDDARSELPVRRDDARSEGPARRDDGRSEGPARRDDSRSEGPARRDDARGESPARRDDARASRDEARPAQTEPMTGPREFWETWVDEKQAREGAPSPTPVAAAPSPAREVEGARPGGDRSTSALDRDRPRRESPVEEPGFIRVYVNVGRREGVNPEDIAAVAREVLGDVAGLGPVRIFGTHTYVSVKEEIASAFCTGVTGKVLRDRALVAEPARR